MKSRTVFGVVLIGILIVATSAHGKDTYAFESKKAVFFRLESSGLSDEKVDEYSSRMQELLVEKTGWEIMDHQTTIQEVVEMGGDRFCLQADCAMLNGRYLNVDYIIFGTVQTVGKSIGINVQIGNVATGRVIFEVAEFYSGKESRFVGKILPKIAEILALDIRNIATSAMDRASERKTFARESIKKQAALKSFSDVRGYLSYGKDENLPDGLSPDGKMAFGYLMIGANMSDDDVLRYSYQLQSYLSVTGAHAMLYIDEMELLMQIRGGELKCPNRKSAKNIGRLLGVDFMGYGKLSRFGRLFFIRTSIVSVETGKRVQSAIKLYHGKEETFLTKVVPGIASELADAFEKNKDTIRLKQKDVSSNSN